VYKRRRLLFILLLMHETHVNADRLRSMQVINGAYLSLDRKPGAPVEANISQNASVG
jgi:hypothetical protein